MLRKDCLARVVFTFGCGCRGRESREFVEEVGRAQILGDGRVWRSGGAPSWWGVDGAREQREGGERGRKTQAVLPLWELGLQGVVSPWWWLRMSGFLYLGSRAWFSE